MSIDYAILVENLIQSLPAISSLVIIEGMNNVVYSTENWDITADLENLYSCWNNMNAPFIMVSGVKYSILRCEIDKLIATSVQGEGHIVGAKDGKMKIIAHLKPEGDKQAAIVEVTKALGSISSNTPYVPTNSQFTTSSAAFFGAQIGTPDINPHLKREIEKFLNWLKGSDGLQGYIEYYLQRNKPSFISELAKIYAELRQVCE